MIKDSGKRFLPKQRNPVKTIPLKSKNVRNEFHSQKVILGRILFRNGGVWEASPSRTQESRRKSSLDLQEF